ncbi:Acid sphingomyelinase phosphodiesterase 3b [Paragonimus heterotremus]|uniref:Acid sphingomyelinase phosphodiesterase 3b n=1 Tax=Paragonimus heterotremus TaxID=100268 RepID=A0A8J4TG05_9TREM|nr:Acid sphingomyelinase phosphodiesterase 3b [Paragonimus heterotremus]
MQELVQFVYVNHSIGQLIVLLVCHSHRFSLFRFLSTGYFWQLTDMHVDLNYTSSGCHGPYGDYECDSPLNLALSAIRATTQFMPQDHRPDFVIWSGDNGPHSTYLSRDELESGIRHISVELQRVFPPDQVYVLPALGNHDVVPANHMQPTPGDPASLAWCHKLASDPRLWGPWIHLANSNSHIGNDRDATPPFANFSTGCFYSHLLRLPGSKLLLLSLNGLLWYSGNPLAGGGGPDPRGQLKWLNVSLDWARREGVKVLLVSHFPPGASENTPSQFKFLRAEFNGPFVNILRANADVLMTGLFAHTHVDSFRVVYDHEDHPLLSLFTAPSITPLHLFGLGTFNPRIRLYRYKRSEGLLLGYSQYFLNLSDPQLRDNLSANWRLEYDTVDAYNLSNLSASSLSTLLDQFAHDDSLTGAWSQYWLHELGGRPHETKPDVLTPDGLCPRARSQCRCEHLCSMRHLDLAELDTCLRECSTDRIQLTSYPLAVAYPNRTALFLTPNTSEISGSSGSVPDRRSSLPIVVGVIIAFLAILVGVVFIVNREICRHRGRYARRLVNDGVSGGGGILFDGRNGTFPLSRNGGPGVAHPTTMVDACNSIAGSSTELRTAFHPNYSMMDDENSLSTLHTADDLPIAAVGRGLPGVADQSPITSAEQKIYGTTLHVSSELPNQIKSARLPNGVMSVSLLNPTLVHRNGKFFPHEIHNYDQVAAQDGDSVPERSGLSSIGCPPEDYYADDEAFGDDEDGPELIPPNELEETDLGNRSVSYSEEDGPFDDGSQLFNLDHRRVSRPSRDWKFIKRSGKGSLQSMEDPLQHLPARDLGMRSSARTLRHSNSVTLGSTVGLLTETRPTATAASTSPCRNGCNRSTDSKQSCIPNGHPDEPCVNPDNPVNWNKGQDGPHRYDYVRI